MNHYITPEVLENGKTLLRFQCEGFVVNNLWQIIQNLNVIGYSVPIDHSLRETWNFRVFLDNGFSIDFTSACTMINEIQEIGSLNIALNRNVVNDVNDKYANCQRIVIPSFCISKLNKLIYEEDNFITECGILLSDATDRTIVVAAGVPPCSVTVSSFFNNNLFKPEFPFLDYKVHVWD